jgi:hypothetical protein
MDDLDLDDLLVIAKTHNKPTPRPKPEYKPAALPPRQMPAIKTPLRGGPLDSMIKENADLRQGQWALARAAIAAAERKRLGAEYVVRFMQNILGV